MAVLAKKFYCVVGPDRLLVDSRSQHLRRPLFCLAHPHLATHSLGIRGGQLRRDESLTGEVSLGHGVLLKIELLA